MLNELKTLSESMSKNGISAYEWHKDFKPLKTTSPCYVVSLSVEGKIDSIRRLNNVSALRTWQGGANGTTFPAFNYTPTFFKKNNDENLISTDKLQLINFIKHPTDFNLPQSIFSLRSNIKEDDKRIKKINKCLKDVSAKFFLATKDDDFVLISKFRTAFDAMLKLCHSEDSFIGFIEEYCASHDSDELMPLVCSKKTYDKKAPDSVVIFFDLADTNDGVVASEATMKKINDKLTKAKDRLSASAQFITDAFGIVCGVSETEDKMPEVKLPGALSNTKLRSMNHESPCQYRYGQISSLSFPVGNEVRCLTKAALEWISSEERKGLTWDYAGSGEIVFAYPKSLPSIPPPLARMLGSGANADDRFAKCASDTVEMLRGLLPNKTNSIELEVFALQKADKARRKVVFYRDYSVEMLKDAVEQWIEGAQNIPSIVIRKWPQKNKNKNDNDDKVKSEKIQIDAPYPLTVSEICYRVWSYDGNSKSIPRCRSEMLCDKIPIFFGLELFLSKHEHVEALSKRLLTLLLQNGDSFFKMAGNDVHLDKVVSAGQTSMYLEGSLAIIGILLYKLGIRKDTYMNKTPYQIGRMLNLADGLHKLYCENVRGKDKLPAELLGASFYTAASTNPVQAFATLGIRMKPYLAWAKTNTSEEYAGLSRWYLSEFAKVSEAITRNGLPTKMNDTDKAQMLLGYLASSKQSDNESDADLNTPKQGE